MNYYRKFILNLATVLKPLTSITKELSLKAKQAEAFVEAKRLLTMAPVLVHYDPSLPIRLATDVSAYGVGVVISHGDEQPIAYASRALAPAESNYAQIEKEALGDCVWNKEIPPVFRREIYPFKPLTAIFGASRGVPALAAARLQRWALQLSAYDYTIEFRSMAKHANADGLSRLPLKGTHAEEGADVRVFQVRQLPIVAADVQRGTRSERVLGKVLRFAREGWPSAPPGEEFKPYFQRKHEMSIENDCLLWGMRVIVPAVFREQRLSYIRIIRGW